MAKKNENRIREGSILGDVIVYIIVGLLCFVALYPMYYVLVISLSDPIYASTLGVYWWRFWGFNPNKNGVEKKKLPPI